MKIIRRAILATVFLTTAASCCFAKNSGTIDFHAYGVLPGEDVETSLPLEYLTCENQSAKITVESSRNWRSLEGPITVYWNDDAQRCDVSAVVDDQKMGTHYYGQAVCSIPKDGAINCDINICKQTENGPPQCQ